MRFICIVLIDNYLLVSKLCPSNIAFDFMGQNGHKIWVKNDARAIYLGFKIPNNEYFSTVMFLSCSTHTGGSIES